MACTNCGNIINTQNTNQANGYIYNTISRIDQIQKEATCVNQCEGCEGGLLSQIFNTKPITIYLAGGTAFQVVNPDNLETAVNLFRIEGIQNDCVVLRLLTRTTTETPTVECLNYTVVLKISCICALQCFAPVCCDKCPGCSSNT